MTTDDTAHPAPTPAPVAVPEGALADIIADAIMVSGTVRVQVVNVGTMTGFMRRESAEFLGHRIADAIAHTAPRPEPVARCSTCEGRGYIPWMIEADPNCYQRVEGDGTVPCPDCRTEPVVAPSDTQSALRGLLERGVGTDLSPTVSPTVDVGWWYDYLRRLDERWRAEVARIADILTLEQAEPVVAPLPSEPAPEAVVLDRDGDAWQRGPEETDGWWCSSPVDEQDISWPRLFKEYGPLRRLVPEDDEDTVRVPRDLACRLVTDLIAMGAESGVGRAEWPAGDDFVTAVVEQTGQTR